MDSSLKLEILASGLEAIRERDGESPELTAAYRELIDQVMTPELFLDPKVLGHVDVASANISRELQRYAINISKEEISAWIASKL
jgi:hypothetical protein